MFELLNSQTPQVNPKKAEKFLEYNTLEQQRRLCPKHVNDLAEEIEAGEFTIGSIAFAHLPDGTALMVNGQHQCSAIIKTGLTIKALVANYQVDDEADVALLYRKFDWTSGSRSLGANARVEAHALRIGWPQRVVSLVIGGVALNTKSGANLRPHKRVELLKSNLREGEFINAILTGGAAFSDSRHIQRAPVVAAMMRTWQKCQSDSETFWAKVRDGDMLKRGMPEQTLRDFLLHYGRNGRNGAKIASQKEFICRCVNSWNAARRHQTQSTIKFFPNKPVPAVV